jgi:hypothetical protein
MDTKHAGGRPLIFKNKEELEKVIDEYFEWCDNRLVQGYDEKENKQFAYISPAPYTMSGLARRIGVDRRTLLNYSDKEEFFPTIARARERVHEDVESRLMGTRNERGAIFNLKNNFGWKEESHQDITSGGKPIPILGGVNVSENNGNQQDL